MRYQAMKRHGGNLSEHYKVREAILKSIHIVRFQLYMTFWKRQNHGNSKEISICQELGEKEG